MSAIIKLASYVDLIGTRMAHSLMTAILFDRMAKQEAGVVFKSTIRSIMTK